LTDKNHKYNENLIISIIDNNKILLIWLPVWSVWLVWFIKLCDIAKNPWYTRKCWQTPSILIWDRNKSISFRNRWEVYL